MTLSIDPNRTWEQNLEDWGFQSVTDNIGERAVDKYGLSVMSFEDDEFEVAWVDDKHVIHGRAGTSLEDLLRVILTIRTYKDLLKPFPIFPDIWELTVAKKNPARKKTTSKGQPPKGRRSA